MELLVWRRTGENSYQLVCANDVHGSVAGSVEQVEVDQADQCEVLPQDVAGWWHAGQGVIEKRLLSQEAHHEDQDAMRMACQHHPQPVGAPRAIA